MICQTCREPGAEEIRYLPGLSQGFDPRLVRLVLCHRCMRSIGERAMTEEEREQRRQERVSRVVLEAQLAGYKQKISDGWLGAAVVLVTLVILVALAMGVP